MKNNNEELSLIEKFDLRKNLPQVAVFAVSAVISVLGLLLLPEKIFVQILSGSPVPETGKTLFLLAALLVVGLAAIMSIISDKRKKWLALETILTLAVTFCVVYNFIVLC